MEIGCKTRLLSSYPVIYPTETSICLKSFKNAVDFHPEGKSYCEGIEHRDVKLTHTRNKRLLDLPYKKPKCCFEIYNIVSDRQKLKKIEKYGLTRPVRTRTHGLEVKEEKKCEPEKNTENVKITYFPECYKVVDSSSDEESDNGESCRGGSVSMSLECCGKTRTELQKIIKKSFGELLVTKEKLCKEKVAEEFKKHKLGGNFKLKLEKIF